MNSFVYEWTNKNTDMKYIGVHKGTPDDGYVCSSKDMLNDYNENPQAFERKILKSFSSFTKARLFENKMCKKVDAARNEMYYNLTNGDGVDATNPKVRRKMSEAAKGKTPWNKGLTKENDLRIEKYSETRKKRKLIPPSRKGISLSEETKTKISKNRKGKGLNNQAAKKLKGIPKKQTTCPYCKKTGGEAAMYRWHFEKCKFR